jgi:outer membrane protein TolC
MKAVAELNDVMTNLEFRIVRLTTLLDSTLKDSKTALEDCEKAIERQVQTILDLKIELADAKAGIEWRDAEIKALKRSLEFAGRERDRMWTRTFLESTS